MTKTVIDDFPLTTKVNPVFVSSMQFLVSSLLLALVSDSHDLLSRPWSLTSVCETSTHFVASVASSLALMYFNFPPSYFQMRSLSISYVFFLTFFSGTDSSMGNVTIPVVAIICGAILASDDFSEFYLPMFVFSIASSISTVHFAMAMKSNLETEVDSKKLSLKVNMLAFMVTLPFSILLTDFSILIDPAFPLYSFIFYIVISGLLSAVASVTTVLLISKTSPLYYVAASSTRQSLVIVMKAIYDPMTTILSPMAMIGHLLCICGSASVLVLHSTIPEKPTALELDNNV